MKHLFTSFLTVLIFSTAPSRLDAVVYWPGSGNGGNRSSAKVSGGNSRHFFAAELPGLSRKPLISEEVKINGRAMTLNIYQLKMSWADLLRLLKSRMAPEYLEPGQDFLKMVIPASSHRTDRWLFVRAEANRPITVFHIEQSGKLPPPVWPKELPQLPAGSRPDMVMEIPRINGIYGSFAQYSGNPEQLLVSYTARMASSGWFNAGAEHSPSIRGTGEIYFRNEPERQILWIKFGADGAGAFYLKKLK